MWVSLLKGLKGDGLGAPHARTTIIPEWDHYPCTVVPVCSVYAVGLARAASMQVPRTASSWLPSRRYVEAEAELLGVLQD